MAIIVSVYFIIKPYYEFLTTDLSISPIKILLSDNSLKKVEDSVNVLVLGIAGGQHDGPNLSDSILVFRYNFKTNHLTTIGIPRDIWSDTLKDKINTAYAYGEAKQEDGGLKLAKAEVGAILGISIQYSAVINFNKFKELIDYLGGIDVNVEHALIDKKFPIEGKENDLCGGDTEYKCRYETLTFNEGTMFMDGKTALKFTRSRNAQGDEGSDFARSRRQQLVISAIKSKVIEIVKNNDIEKIKKLYQKADSLVNRDVSNQEVAIMFKDIVFSKNYSQRNVFLPEDLFIVPNYADYDNKYVLIPAENFDVIHQFVLCLFEKEDEDTCLKLNKVEKKE